MTTGGSSSKSTPKCTFNGSNRKILLFIGRPMSPHQGQANFYTMSGKGVTHFRDGEADFSSLESFEREYFQFTKMMRLRLFRQYRMWKAFKVMGRGAGRRGGRRQVKGGCRGPIPRHPLASFPRHSPRQVCLCLARTLSLVPPWIYRSGPSPLCLPGSRSDPVPHVFLDL